MNLPDFSTWPVTLAQSDTSPAPGGAPVDTSPAPGGGGGEATGDGNTTSTTGDAGTGEQPTQTARNPIMDMLPLFAIVIAIMLIFSMGGNRKEKKRRAELMTNLSKGAKVTTVGGVIGTVVEVREDAVLVKVDESTNTRMLFSKAAISAVTSED